MSDFLFSIGVVVPLFILITLGFLLKKKRFIDGDFVATGNKVCFLKIFLPALLFINIYQTDVSEVIDFGLSFFAVAAVIGTILVCVAVIPLCVKERPKAAVMIQAAFRSNFIIFGLPLAEMIGVPGGPRASYPCCWLLWCLCLTYPPSSFLCCLARPVEK